MKLTVQQIIDNTIDEMRRAIDRLREVGDFNDEAITGDEELISDLEAEIERLETIPDTIKVALCLAVYAGNLEEKGVAFVNDFGADSFANREKYLAFAEQYEIPIDEGTGLFATDAVYDEIAEAAKEMFVFGA